MATSGVHGKGVDSPEILGLLCASMLQGFLRLRFGFENVFCHPLGHAVACIGHVIALMAERMVAMVFIVAFDYVSIGCWLLSQVSLMK